MAFRLTPDILLEAYAAGIFPMAESADDPELFWVDPTRRGIIPLDNFHVPRRLKRVLRGGSLRVRCDTQFEAVMRACAEVSDTRPTTWINDEVGGLYGVSLGTAFFGESMFSRMTDASKVALVHLVTRLRLGGYRLLDTQFLTPHLAQFGAVEVTRARYHRMLAEALRYRAVFPRDLPEGEAGGGGGSRSQKSRGSDRFGICDRQEWRFAGRQLGYPDRPGRHNLW